MVDAHPVVAITITIATTTPATAAGRGAGARTTSGGRTATPPAAGPQRTGLGNRPQEPRGSAT
jgi:hypothetical protein